MLTTLPCSHLRLRRCWQARPGIIDIENPKSLARPDLQCDGKIKDARDVKVGMTNVSLFAYIADGETWHAIVQLTSPETPGNGGFSPRPAPELIAIPRSWRALAISEGLDRDRAVDESGNQLAVFGRRGSRPFNLDEMKRLFMKDGAVFTVPDLKKADEVRRHFGTPKAGDTAERKNEAPRQVSLLPGSRRGAIETFGLAALFVPLAIALFRWRKRAWSSRASSLASVAETTAGLKRDW